jgi:hypothetical protein
MSPRDARARLNIDGRLDTDFGEGLAGIGKPAGPAAVRACALQSNGRILVGGEFESVHGVTRRRVARLLPSGDRFFRDGFE